jgi:putative membrane protein
VPAGTDTIANNPAAKGDLTADTRILSILSVKDQEEVEIGRLAQTNGSAQDVKDFGGQLVKDHTEHGAKVRSVASAAGITLMDPTQVKATIAAEKGKDVSEMKDPIAELRALNGSDFDKKFAEKMRAGHMKLISMVEKAQYDVKNANVKDLLAQTLPTLREHEQMAAKLNGENTDNYTSPSAR